MGNCGLKPKVLSETGAPAPEELKDSLLKYHKIDDGKSLSNLFLQDKVETKTKDVEKITVEDIAVAEDLKTALVEEKSLTKEAKSPTKEMTSQVTETKHTAGEKKTEVNEDLKTILEEAKPLVTETKAPVDEEKAKNEETVYEEKVIDVVTVKETETDAKAEKMEKDAA